MAKPAPQILPVAMPLDDIRQAAATMTQAQARRVLLGYWRALQTLSSNNLSINSLKRTPYPEDADHVFLQFFSTSYRRMVAQMKKGMAIYADQHVASRWAIDFKGIGPLISSGLYCFIDLNKCKDNPQKVWRHAGLDPNARWITYAEIDPKIGMSRILYGNKLKESHMKYLCEAFYKPFDITTSRAKRFGKGDITWKSFRSSLAVRPWNPELKLICYYLGQGIKRKQPSPYAELYTKRREYEYQVNANLGYEERALEIYRSRNWIDTSPESVSSTYKKGLLPGFEIERRARRWVVKLFLVHFHQVLYYEKFNEMPKKPWIVRYNKGLGEIVCPNWPFKEI